MPQLFLKIRLSSRQKPGHQNRGNNRTDTTYKPSFNCYFLVISHFRFSKYKNLKLFCLQQPLVIIQKQDDYDTNGARRIAFRHHHIESLSGFASIYTPTLIFLSHCCFSFSCGKYTTFFFNCILFGHFFQRNFEKGVKEFNLRSQLLIIYILNFRKFRSYRSVRVKLPKRRRQREKDEKYQYEIKMDYFTFTLSTITSKIVSY